MEKVRPEGVIANRWYWVREGTEYNWFPALWDDDTDWTNTDTWEDFQDQMTEWKLIPLPEEIP